MIDLNTIAAYKAQIPKKTLEEDKAFLLALGEFLESAARKELQGAFIFELEDLIHQLQLKYIKSINKDVKSLLAEVKHVIFDIAQRAEDERVDIEYFRNVTKLGELLKYLAAILEILILPVYTQNISKESLIREILNQLQNSNLLS